jgi:hypothetical protein
MWPLAFVRAGRLSPPGCGGFAGCCSWSRGPVPIRATHPITEQQNNIETDGKADPGSNPRHGLSKPRDKAGAQGKPVEQLGKRHEMDPRKGILGPPGADVTDAG